MKGIKTILGALAAASLLFSVNASAQENNNRDENGKVVRGAYETNKAFDNTFISIAAGVNTVVPIISETKNWGNIGLGREEIIAAEEAMIHGTVGTQVEMGGRPGGRTTTLDVTSAQTEAELCASRGIGYFRLTVLDHSFSDPDNIDEFIAFVRNLPEDTWLHVHCQGGVGRTNMYLVFYDFLRNPDVPEKDVIYRHFNQGGNFMYYKGDKPNEEAYKVPLAQEKAEMIPLFYQYVQEQQPKGFKRTWTQWKAKKK